MGERGLSERGRTVLQMDNRLFLPQVVQLIGEGHQVTIMARGNSMRPFIEDGRDELIFGRVDGLKRGDVVLAEVTEGVYICHRIEHMADGKITMRGDGNVAGTEVFPAANVRAKLLKINRLGKTYDLQTSRCWKLYSAIWPRLLPLRRYLLACYRLLWLGQWPERWQSKQ